MIAEQVLAAATAAQLRVTAARYPADDGLVVLLDELAGSPEFRMFWARSDVEVRTHGAKSFRVPGVGVLTLTYENLEVAGAPRQRLVALCVNHRRACRHRRFRALNQPQALVGCCRRESVQ
ncbi:hypothetical protein ABIA39_007693 [Nocardia sp. GAS34]|uniref:MmyB family transcriptional regulator n=1 Tax=unclassified Nocardia TaxID=2637762 RepID=UPI003D22E0C7